MRIAVFVLCLIGGIIGILGSIAGFGLLGLSVGLSESVGETAAAEETAALGGRVLLGFIAGIATLVAGSMVLARKAPRRWGLVLIVVNVVGSLAAGGFYMFGGALGLIAGVIALLIRPERIVAASPPWAGPPPGWGQPQAQPWSPPPGTSGSQPPGAWHGSGPAGPAPGQQQPWGSALSGPPPSGWSTPPQWAPPPAQPRGPADSGWPEQGRSDG